MAESHDNPFDLMELNSQIDDITESSTYSETLQDVIILPDWQSLLEKVNIAAQGTAGNPEVRGIEIHNNQVYLVRSNSSDIEVYNRQDFRTRSGTITVRGLTEAASLVSCSFNNCLYVSNYSNPGCIYKITITDKGNSQKGWLTEGSPPGGLSISNKHHLLVCACNDGRIDKYDTEGKLLGGESIRLRNDIKRLHRAVELKNERFLVSYSLPEHRISVIDSNGSILHSFGHGHGSAPEQLDWPRYPAVDESDNVLLADVKNNKLKVFNFALQYLGDLNLCGVQLQEPTCFCWDNCSGRLFVGTNQGGLVSIKFL